MNLIYRWFIQPMLDKTPPHIEESAFLETLWDVKSRIYTAFQVERAFAMPGLYLEVPHTKFYGRGPRQVKPGDALLIRDEPSTECLHVSLITSSEEEHTFELTETEWHSIERFVTEVEDPCSHLPST
jgi:hypothetical protein